MGVGCCIRIDAEKQRILELISQEKQKRQLEELRSFYHMNKQYMNSKIRVIFKEIYKNGSYSNETINFNFVNFQKSRSDHLFQLMPYFQNIKVLRLWKTCLGSEGIKMISKDLSHMHHLEVLSLEDNSLGEEGCMHLSIPLKNLRNLIELWLHINEIGAVGAFCIAEVLLNLKNLQKLGLDENNMENKGSLKVAMALCNLKQLKMLGIGYNLITEDALLNIAQLICDLNLEKLIVSGNTIREEMHGTLMNLLPRTLIIF
jgi:Ran GTPase-activating protein (RanGAP) involved in mRNA processing and transport